MKSNNNRNSEGTRIARPIYNGKPNIANTNSGTSRFLSLCKILSSLHPSKDPLHRVPRRFWIFVTVARVESVLVP